MISLRPISATNHQCPFCRVSLESRGWHVPGMRNLAEMQCVRCGREFYADLPSGQALYTPMLLEKATGIVHDSYGVEWFAEWLRASYAERTDAPLPFDVREFSPITREVVLLNCLDTLYGHSLLKLLNVQHYLDCTETHVIVIVPSFLEWMIPAGVAQAWVVGLPLRDGSAWNEWLAREIHRRLDEYPRLYLSLAFSHPHQRDYNIERFTRVAPFVLEQWSDAPARPVVTFIWREDRLWDARAKSSGHAERLRERIKRPAVQSDEQRRRVSATAEALRREWPALDFAVAGLGTPGDLPGWMTDLRRTNVDAATERLWCERYAASHTVVGVHGSNMLLPSAHAGSVVELIGAEREGNFLQDILFRGDDNREMFFRYRFVPDTTTPAELARLVSFMLRRYPDFQRLMGREFCRHAATGDASRWHSSSNDNPRR